MGAGRQSGDGSFQTDHATAALEIISQRCALSQDGYAATFAGSSRPFVSTITASAVSCV